MARKGLSHIALKVRDLKKTEDFYVGVFGLKVAFRHPPGMIFLTTPGSGDLLNFVKTAQRPRANQGLEHLASKSRSTELKKHRRKIAKAGVKIDGRRGKTAFYISRSQRLSARILIVTRPGAGSTAVYFISHPIASLSRSKQTQLILLRPAEMFRRQLRPAFADPRFLAR